MKSKLLPSLILLLACALVCAAFISKTANTDERPSGSFSAIDTIKKFLEPFPVNAQFAIAVVSPQGVKYYGVKKEEPGIKEIVNQNSLFEIGSMTKVFTSVITATLINDGKMKLDDPIQKFLPFKLRKINGVAPLITIQHLANHTSGFQRGPSNMNPKDPEDPYADYDSTLLYTYLRDSLALDNPVGAKFAYSNLGVGLLGFLVAKQMHKPYEVALKETILDPLKMNNTCITIPEKLSKTLVRGLDQDGKEVSNWNLDALAGAGAIRSNTTDMAKFLAANINPTGKLGDAISKTQQVTFRIDSIAGLGMGWFIMQRHGKTRFTHNGGTGGYRSCMMIDKKTQRGVVVLNNVSAFHPSSRSVDELCKKLLEE